MQWHAPAVQAAGSCCHCCNLSQAGGTDADVTAPQLKEERGGHWTEEQHLQMGALHEELPESSTTGAAHGAEHHWQREEAEKALGHEHAERLLAEQVCTPVLSPGMGMGRDSAWGQKSVQLRLHPGLVAMNYGACCASQSMSRHAGC